MYGTDARWCYKGVLLPKVRTLKCVIMTTIIMGDQRHGINSKTTSSIPQSSSLPSLTAAHEVLALLGYTLDMWSRHKDSLRVLAYGGDMSEEEVGVVERLGSELRELWEEMMVVEPAEQQQEGASSSEPSPSGDDGEEDDGAAAPLSEVSKVQTVWI